MEDLASLHLTRLQGQLGDIVYELTKMQFSHFRPVETWRPAINAYRCQGQITICTDLAGVDKSAIQVRVERRRLIIRGRREPPEPASPEHKPVEILAMEIDYGPFEREFELPTDVQTEQITAEQRNGMLWVYLPLRPQA